MSQFKIEKTESDELCKEFLEDSVEKIPEDEEAARALPVKPDTSPGQLDDDEEKAIGVSPDGRFLKFEVSCKILKFSNLCRYLYEDYFLFFTQVKTLS